MNEPNEFEIPQIPWARFIPVLVSGGIFGALIFAFTNANNPAQAATISPQTFYTKEEMNKASEISMKIDIDMLKRIEVIEDKLGITPPADSARLIKKQEG